MADTTAHYVAFCRISARREQTGPTVPLPSLAYIQLNPKYFDMSYKEWVGTATHELIHAMGFTSPQFRMAGLIEVKKTGYFFTGPWVRQLLDHAMPMAWKRSGEYSYMTGHWYHQIETWAENRSFYPTVIVPVHDIMVPTVGLGYPLTTLTLYALADIGYTLDDEGVVPFEIPLPLFASEQGPPAGKTTVRTLCGGVLDDTPVPMHKDY